MRSPPHRLRTTGATRFSLIHKCDPPPGRRTRKKWVRLFIGRGRRRRIWSTNARSHSRWRADRRARLGLAFFLFIEGFLQDVEHGPVAVAAGGALALDNVGKTRDLQLVFAERDRRRAGLQPFDGIRAFEGAKDPALAPRDRPRG